MPRLKANINPEYLKQRIAASPFKKTAIAKMIGVKLYTLSDWTQGRVRIPAGQEKKLEDVLTYGEMVYGGEKPPTVRREIQEEGRV